MNLNKNTPDEKQRKDVGSSALFTTIDRAILYVSGAILSLIVAVVVIQNTRPLTERRTIWSPDKQYKIVVYSKPGFGFGMPAMPGQGSDVPGVMKLVRSADGVVLKTASLEMVQDVDQHSVNWDPDKVMIVGFNTWPLER